MNKRKNRKKITFERFSIDATKWIGSVESLALHTVIFISAFILYFYGFSLEKILLVLTTAVSLEAIYLAIFIQMSVNRQAKKLKDVARDIDEIQEDVEEIQEDVEEIEKDVDEIQEDIDEIQEDVEEIQEEEIDDNEQKKDADAILRIEETLKILINEISELKEQRNSKIKKD